MCLCLCLCVCVCVCVCVCRYVCVRLPDTLPHISSSLIKQPCERPHAADVTATTALRLLTAIIRYDDSFLRVLVGQGARVRVWGWK
jgi:hypothetical protein